MKRIAQILLALIAVIATLAATSPSYADPPNDGFVGVILSRGGTEPDRPACDKLDHVRVLYGVGKDNAYLVPPKVDELARDAGIDGKPPCTISSQGKVKVLESVYLGPIKNFAGSLELFIWAVHVEKIDTGGATWMMYLDLKGEYHWLKAGVEI